MADEKQPYHRHNLPETLRAAAADLVSERGPSGFSLREVARRAGVSHAAPAHHFGDTRGLLTSLATEGFERLTCALSEAATEPDAIDRLRRCGTAYVQTALDFPGHFAVLFQSDLLDTDDPELERHGTAAFQCLIDTIEAVRDQINPDLDVERASMLCWATMQGLVSIRAPHDEKTGEHGEPLPEVIDGLVSMMLDGFRPR